MRIQTVINVGHPVHGGAQLTHRTWLRLLARHFAHDCTYLDASPVAVRPRRGEIVERVFRDLDELAALTRAFRPDVAILAFDVVHRALPLLRRLGVPVVAALNSFEYCPPTRAEVARWQLGFERPYPTAEERERVFDGAAAVVVNSEFLRQRLLVRTGVRATIVHPAFDPDEILVPGHDAAAAPYVTGVCGHPHKGAAIFHALALALPDVPFLVAGPVHHAWAERFRACPNLRHVPFSPPREVLAASRVVLVPSQWAEPFGRIAVEAMANGIPVLASRTGGLAEIVGDSALGVARFRDAGVWRRRLERLLRDPAAFRAQAEEGRRRAAPYVGLRSIRRLHALAARIARAGADSGRRARTGAGGGRGARRGTPLRPTVAIAGDTDARTAYARINRVWRDGLRVGGHWNVAHAPRLDAAISADVVVHHDYAHDFTSASLPGEGRLVAVRTWDFGPFPQAWVERIATSYDELWVYSRWTRAKAIEAGVPAARVKVVPLGFDPAVMRPDGPVRRLPTTKRFRFLFVGATVPRKGVDVLLAAYRRAFRASDDVCLVVKDHARDVFYDGVRLAGAPDDGDRDAPEILYLDDELAPAELAALYRACDAGVFPFRAEGFCLPLLEAMACGVPSLLPRFGAPLDFCDARTAWLVPARRICLPVGRDFAFNTLGFREIVPAVDFCEVQPDVLADAMRAVVAEDPAARRARGRAAAAHVARRWRWTDSVAAVERRLAHLRDVRVPVRFRRERALQEVERRRFEIARALYVARGLAPAAG